MPFNLTVDVPPAPAVPIPASDAAESDAALPGAAGRGAVPPPRLAGLRQLMRLRSLAITGQAAAIAIAWAMDIALHVWPMALLIAALLALNLYTASRVRRGAPATHREVAAHIALDLAAFTLLLILAGGTANPFGLLYLLHVVLIALLLPWRLAFAGAGLVIASFALAFRFAEPLRHANGEPLSDALMAIGLWVSFVLTTLVTTWFVAGIVAELRTHERLLREAARKALNDEAMLHLGTLAAGAAHELGTPLMTMAVLAAELRRDADTPARQRDTAILAAQIDACRSALANLAAAAGQARTVGGGRAPLDGFLANIVARFQAVRPDVPLHARWNGTAPVPEIFADQSLQQAILILLNNAADASPHHVEIDGRWDAEVLRLTVGDRGAGVPEGSLGNLGRAFFTTKPPGKGTGMGLVLTASTVSRLGGTVRWTNRNGGGLSAEITLPLRSLLLTNTPR